MKDRKEGYGEFTWPSGAVFKGQWRDGKQHGEGWMKDEEGKVKTGRWEEGEFKE